VQTQINLPDCPLTLPASGSQGPIVRTLVLGLGNDILTDDAVGLFVARRLHDEFAGLIDIDIEETQEMGLALLDYLEGYDQAFIVDSIQTGKAVPGTLHELDASALARLTGGTPHFVGVGEALALGRYLGLEMPAKVKVFAIEVEDPFTLGLTLSPAVEEAFSAICERIRSVVLNSVEI
jgi:hydrogenase maturation protease